MEGKHFTIELHIPSAHESHFLKVELLGWVPEDTSLRKGASR